MRERDREREKEREKEIVREKERERERERERDRERDRERERESKGFYRQKRLDSGNWTIISTDPRSFLITVDYTIKD